MQFSECVALCFSHSKHQNPESDQALLKSFPGSDSVGAVRSLVQILMQMPHAPHIRIPRPRDPEVLGMRSKHLGHGPSLRRAHITSEHPRHGDRQHRICAQPCVTPSDHLPRTSAQGAPSNQCLGSITSEHLLRSGTRQTRLASIGFVPRPLSPPQITFPEHLLRAPPQISASDRSLQSTSSDQAQDGQGSPASDLCPALCRLLRLPSQNI